MSSDNVMNFPAIPSGRGNGDKSGGPGNTGNGNGTGGSDLEKRVDALEKTAQEVRERLVRVETKIDGIERNMATNSALSELNARLVGEIGTIRTSLTSEIGSFRTSSASEIGTVNQSVANFRTEITRLEGTMIKWFVGTALALSAGIGAIAFGLARALH